jgi:hypothetical protein
MTDNQIVLVIAAILVAALAGLVVGCYKAARELAQSVVPADEGLVWVASLGKHKYRDEATWRAAVAEFTKVINALQNQREALVLTAAKWPEIDAVNKRIDEQFEKQRVVINRTYVTSFDLNGGVAGLRAKLYSA